MSARGRDALGEKDPSSSPSECWDRDKVHQLKQNSRSQQRRINRTSWESQLDRTIRDPTPSKMGMMEQSWDACVVLRALLDLESAEPPLASTAGETLNPKWKISTRDFGRRYKRRS